MLIRKDSKYEPKTINDIIWGNAESRLRIEDIVSGAEALPYCGKSAILLYGVFGTGKTTLANLLPNAIEKGRTNEDLAIDADFIACQQGFNGPQVMSVVSQINEIALRGLLKHLQLPQELHPSGCDSLLRSQQGALVMYLNQGQLS